MEKNFLGVYEACLMGRLGQTYNGNRTYREAVRTEEALFGQLWEGLTEEQQGQLNDWRNAMGHSVSICERLAYRQGMRDMATLLYGE